MGVALRQENLALTTYLIQLRCLCTMHSMTYSPYGHSPVQLQRPLEPSSFLFK
jgi:hypothetical protein